MALRLCVLAILACVSIRAGDPITIPFEFYGNAIWLKGTINGKGPFHIQLDTAAAGSVLNTSKIAETGLTVLYEGEQESAGSGDSRTHIAMLEGTRFEIGGVRLEFERLAAISLDEVSRAYGTPIDAILGYQLMSRYVVKIDFDEQMLTLYDPGTFTYKGDGVVLPLEVRQRTPIVRAGIRLPGLPPIEGDFLVDEPHPGALMFTTPFIDQHDLLTAARKVTSRMIPGSAIGVGGRFEVQDGRIESLQLGPFEMKRPTAGFPRARAGAFARNDIAGILGGEVWRRFRVWLDYAHGQMILERGARYGDPFEYDASGLKLITGPRSHKEFVVLNVTNGTPAAEAGIRKDDILAELGGVAASDLTLWEIRKMLRKPGQKYALKLRRGSSEITTALETRPLTQ